MPNNRRVPLSKEAKAALEKSLIADETPANIDLFPAKPGTSDFAIAAKLRFDEKMSEFKEEMGPALFDKYCAVSFVSTYDNDMGVCDASEGRTTGMMMLMATIVLRLAEVTQEAQRFRPKRDSMHKICAGIIHRLMQMIMVMVPASGDEGPQEDAKKDSGIIIP